VSLLYHLMMPQPAQPALDAVVQEAESLRSQFGGEIVYLNPARKPGSLYPERLYGLHRLFFLRRQEAAFRLHHVYNAHPFFFPYLRWLRRPIIYSVTAGLKPSLARSRLKGFERLSAIVVSNERDGAILRQRGLENIHVIQPGIDTSRFKSSPPPRGVGFTLLVGSAPWTEAQFHSKGVEALLAAAEARPDLRLIFLWRGLLFEVMQARVAQHGVQARVEVIDQRVDVNEVLARAHAAVVLAADATLVKAFPHSLLEALAAGRPVLVSRALPMADYVAQTGCGQVVEEVSPEAVLAAMARLEANYKACQPAARRAGQRDFSRQALAEAYGRLYQTIQGSSH
jgi:glycosyltransferase involved in cell wall biosynthesis